MIGFSFSDIESAYAFVSAAPRGGNSAYLNVETGEIYYQSELMGIDESSGKKIDGDRMIEIPHKNDLGLGQSLIFEFVDVNLPDDYRLVCDMFRQKGAYRRYKGLLESRGMLEAWYRFENEREEKALRAWCEENEIPLSD